MISGNILHEKLTRAGLDVHADPVFNKNNVLIVNHIKALFKKRNKNGADCGVEMWINSDGNLVVEPVIGGIKRKTIIISPATVEKLRGAHDRNRIDMFDEDWLETINAVGTLCGIR
jgi:hypothetical protein